MRNRKTVIVAFMLVAVLLMAVGYAVLSTDLYIGGKINDTAFQRFVGAIDEFNIYNYAFDADAIADSAN